MRAKPPEDGTWQLFCAVIILELYYSRAGVHIKCQNGCGAKVDKICTSSYVQAEDCDIHITSAYIHKHIEHGEHKKLTKM